MSGKIYMTIIGAGLIGCALAYRLSGELGTKRDIVVIEKNNQVNAENQSSRNSGVIHSGIYYPQDIGPLKAALCLKGNRLLYGFCKRYGVPHKKTGKLMVATDKMEEEYLEDVYRIAGQNRVPDVEMIGPREISCLEPNVTGKRALYIPTAGIVEPTLLIKKLHQLAEDNGVIFLMENEVTGIGHSGSDFSITIKSRSGDEVFKTHMVVNAAGLYSDEIAGIINPSSPYIIDAIKGESAKFYCSAREDIKMSGLNVYPVPFGYYPDGEKLVAPFSEFKNLFYHGRVHKSAGVHLSPTIDMQGSDYMIGDTVTVGPAYSRPRDKEDYSSTRDAGYYHSMVKSFFPGIKPEDISLHQAGIRAKLSGFYDFVIERDPGFKNFINLTGIDSPGLTASLAIAGYTANLIL
ncbi:MAG: NAD(P)/FAD-dependent oxidoreductase [Actinobacteria bacterium]|nr:NAD(P)/FAD-dependent oxidoreductase [Actinomycetota bacterium]